MNASVSVREHDEDNAHGHVCDLSGVVKDGWVKIPWKVVYMEDNDDSTNAKELMEKGYTLPEYHFVAESIREPKANRVWCLKYVEKSI